MVRAMPGVYSVEELIQLPSETGAFSYYRVVKHNKPVVSVRAAMASQFDVTPSAIVFPGLRDFRYNTVQYASVRKAGPDNIKGDGFTAQCIQNGPRALRTADLLGNRFTIRLRHLSDAKANALADIFNQIHEYGLPNYFGSQRFRSMTQYGFIGKAILKHDPLEALRLYLSEPNLNDSKSTSDFKALAKSHWGQWGFLLHQAPRPSNYRSVITYLKEHPRDYEKALNLIRDQLLARYLVTYQAWIWNRILANYLRSKAESTSFIDIAGLPFPLSEPDAYKKYLKDLLIPLPRLTAFYPGDLAEAVDLALSEEGISSEDLNVRLMRRVCLVKRDREAWFAPTEVKIKQSSHAQDSENHTMTISFDLEIRQYATLVIKAALACLDDI